MHLLDFPVELLEMIFEHENDLRQLATNTRVCKVFRILNLRALRKKWCDAKLIIERTVESRWERHDVRDCIGISMTNPRRMQFLFDIPYDLYLKSNLLCSRATFSLDFENRKTKLRRADYSITDIKSDPPESSWRFQVRVAYSSVAPVKPVKVFGNYIGSLTTHQTRQLTMDQKMVETYLAMKRFDLVERVVDKHRKHHNCNCTQKELHCVS